MQNVLLLPPNIQDKQQPLPMGMHTRVEVVAKDLEYKHGSTFLLTPEDTTPSDYTQRCQTLITVSGNSLKLATDNFINIGSVG